MSYTDDMRKYGYVAAGDVARQLIEKGGVKSYIKPVIVGGSNAVYCKMLSPTVAPMLAKLTGETYYSALAGEIMGTGAVVYGLDMVGLISPKNAKSDADTGGRRNAGVTASMMLAGKDIVAARVIQYGANMAGVGADYANANNTN